MDDAAPRRDSLVPKRMKPNSMATSMKRRFSKFSFDPKIVKSVVFFFSKSSTTTETASGWWFQTFRWVETSNQVCSSCFLEFSIKPDIALAFPKGATPFPRGGRPPF